MKQSTGASAIGEVILTLCRSTPLDDCFVCEGDEGDIHRKSLLDREVASKRSVSHTQSLLAQMTICCGQQYPEPHCAQVPAVQLEEAGNGESTKEALL